MNDTIKTLTEMLTAESETGKRMEKLSPDNAIAQRCFARRDALDAAIKAMELLEQSSRIEFGNDYICRLGGNPPEYGLYAKGEAGYGDYSSYYEAFTALKEKK